MDLAIAEWMFCLFHEVMSFAVPATVIPLGRLSSTPQFPPQRFQAEWIGPKGVGTVHSSESPIKVGLKAIVFHQGAVWRMPSV
jgi:hypothetical protein